MPLVMFDFDIDQIEDNVSTAVLTGSRNTPEFSIEIRDQHFIIHSRKDE